MFKRCISPSLALVFLFICPETFSQVTNNVCAKDDLASEFALGRFSDANMTITSKTNGELSLKTLAPDEDFNDDIIPVGWNGSPWITGGSTDFSGGIANLNGSRIYKNEKYLPGTSIEFSARFTLGNFENIGFAKNGNFDLFWLVIGRGGIGSDPNLYVRSSDGVSVSLGDDLLNEYHNYRITWGEANFTIYVDEVLAATVKKTYTTDLIFLISDYNNDGSSLSIDWIRYGFSSHPGFGTYDSRVFPISNSTASLRVNWNATLPENTGIHISVRSGNTPIPDNTWTPLTTVINNQLININNIYLQYHATLNSIPGTFTPLLNDISFSCSEVPVPPVVTPLLINNISIEPNLNGSATIRWNTNINSNSRVDFGTSPESLASSTSDAFLTTLHVLSITGLTQGSTYYIRLSSIDAENHIAISPSTALAPLQFTVPVYSPECAKDDLISEFEKPYLWGSTEAVNIINGELALKPFSKEENFHSNTVPEGWNAGSWSAEGISNFSFGIATLNGTRIYTTETFQPGASFKCYARFTLGNYQNIGFAKNGNFEPFWLGIGRGGIASDPNLYVRTSEGINMSLGNNLLDAYHEYRIDWETDKFLVYVDGILSASVTKTYSSPLLLMVSDHDFDGTTLSVDWIRFTKKIYPNTGIYLSKIFSLGPGPASTTVNWNSTLPTNTAVTISVRSGNATNPDGGGWSSFVPVTNHQSIDLGKSYLQYQAVLSTTNTKVTPLLHDIRFDCGPTAPVDITSPVIREVQVNIISEGKAVVYWLTDEPASGRLDFGTDPGNLTSSVTEDFLGESHSALMSGLTEGTTYFYRVTTTDAANNSAGLPIISVPPLQFTYPFLSNDCAKDGTASEFDAGETGSNIEILQNIFFGNDGSIALKKTDNSVTEEFLSTTIPVGWNAGTWSPGGTTTYSGNSGGIPNVRPPVLGGFATLNGTRIYSSEKFLPGTTITFSAKFSLGNYENIGFAQNGDFDPFWIVIGRGQLGADPNLYVRTSDGVNISLGSNLLDNYHSYRITWGSNNFAIYVDGKIITTVTKTFLLPMLLQISDYNNDGTFLSIERITSGLPSYPASGTFISRVFSLGSMPDFATVSWNRNSPGIDLSGKTAMFISVRSGNNSTPDGSWTKFQEVAQNQLFKPIGSYLQYQAVLVSKDLESTPVLNDISFTCSGPQPGNVRTYITNPSQSSILSSGQAFALEQNRPNPFNNTTIVSYSVPKPVRVLLTIYDLQGRVVKIVEDAHRSPGKYYVNIDTRMMGKGVYIYRIQAGEFSATKKMIVE